MKRTFDTLKQFIEYIPNCLICQKPMQVILEGWLQPSLPVAPKRRLGTSETFKLRFQLKDGILRGKHKSNTIIVDTTTNKIIDGKDVLDRLAPGQSYVNKNCNTCDFKINGNYIVAQKTKDCFAPVSLAQEQLTYTMKGGKSIQVVKYYDDRDTNSGEMVTIALDKKWFNHPVPLDFSKFTNVAQLSKRLKTIIVFQ